MFHSTSETIIRKYLPELPTLVIEKSLASDFDELVAAIVPRGTLTIVCDQNTEHAMADALRRALMKKYALHIMCFDRGVRADMDAVRKLQTISATSDALIAVGSGTINDITKYVSFLTHRPYLVFPTAASMNGYVSANASISVDGHKTTLAAHMPLAVFCDLTVIASAPLRLSQSGLGDSLARPTAQADWLLSHFLAATDYNEAVFAMMMPYEERVFDEARGVALRDGDILQDLMRLLLLSGFGMTIVGGSYPASQGEHMIAHAMEMRLDAGPQAPLPLHGETIAVTTLTMARMQESLLRSKHIRLRPADYDMDAMRALYGDHIAIESRKAFTKKMNLQPADSAWDNVKEKILPISLPSAQIESILKAAGCPTQHEQIGWDTASYNNAVATARYTRDRITFLDIE